MEDAFMDDMAEMEARKEVKVKLPVAQLMRLHYLKLTTHRTFSEMVSEALDEYFKAHPIKGE